MSARAIEQLTCGLEAHGYWVDMEPLADGLDAYEAALREAFRKVEATVARNARQYGFRGLSKRAIAALHLDLPEPTWGVVVRP